MSEKLAFTPRETVRMIGKTSKGVELWEVDSTVVACADHATSWARWIWDQPDVLFWFGLGLLNLSSSLTAFGFGAAGYAVLWALNVASYAILLGYGIAAWRRRRTRVHQATTPARTQSPATSKTGAAA